MIKIKKSDLLNDKWLYPCDKFTYIGRHKANKNNCKLCLCKGECDDVAFHNAVISRKLEVLQRKLKELNED